MLVQSSLHWSVKMNIFNLNVLTQLAPSFKIPAKKKNLWF